jgi:phosphoketolase
VPIRTFTQPTAGHRKVRLKDQIIEHLAYAHAEGIDDPRLRNWQWPVHLPAIGG